MFDYMEVGVRRGRRPASTKDRFADTMSAKPARRAQWFWPLLPKQKWLVGYADETALACHPPDAAHRPPSFRRG
ncbi:MAG TPA: hypothetical protein VF292_10590 [Rhodanobacteraceae bacterium]